MTLPWSGPISFLNINAEIGNGSNPISLAWVRDNSFYSYRDLGSIYGLTWFQAVSSQNNVSRTTASTTSNCAQNCFSRPRWAGPYTDCNYIDCKECWSSWYRGGECFSRDNCTGVFGGLTLVDCALISSVNCNQCGYTSGAAMLQKNCNCNCNCYNCNCRVVNCDCNNCDCAC